MSDFTTDLRELAAYGVLDGLSRNYTDSLREAADRIDDLEAMNKDLEKK